MDYGHRALRAHVGAPFFVVLPRKEQAVLVECSGFFVYQVLRVHTRSIVWVSVHTSIRLARRTNCCSLSAENGTANNLTKLGPLSDLS